jgi:hypothetical protein
MNITITVPPHTSDHGNLRLLCLPPKWYDYIYFYFTNYFAHAATIATFPGQGFDEMCSAIFLAVLFPGTGVNRASQNIVRFARRFRNNPLKQAAYAGALCMVVKDDDSWIDNTYPQDPEADQPVTASASPQ